jgi:hypothetical protein
MASPRAKGPGSLDTSPGAKELTMIRLPSLSGLSLAGLAGLVGLGVFSAVGVTGCADKHIGRICAISASSDAGTDPNFVAVNSLALECPSRICILPAQEKSPNGTGPLCTDSCSSDDDCSDGEKRTGTKEEDPRCATGFACRVIIPDLKDVPLSCQKICVCKDFLGPSTSVPESCK